MYYHYEYDSVGNRLQQVSAFLADPVTTAYAYDDANRLTTAGGQTYSFDANGNLTSDGTYTYSYDTANRLVGVATAASAVTYRYNGDGNRVQQSSNGVDTNYTLELNSGLSQVLADGTNTYLYGMNRLGMSNTTGNYLYEYDALGSVRQMENIAGLTLAEIYDPYGNVILSSGQAGIYGYSGEEQSSTGLVYLRARFMSPGTGTFLSRDTWDGDANLPMSYNQWMYGYSNPVRYTDPSGKSSCESGTCEVPVLSTHRNDVLGNYVQGYNPEIEPPFIKWYSNAFARKITDGKAPIYNNEGMFLSDYEQAQFYIQGHYAYSEVNKHGKLTKSCNTMYCGQLVLAAILKTLYPQITVNPVIDDFKAYHPTCGDTGTGASELMDYLNINYQEYFLANVNKHKESELPIYLRHSIARGKVIIPIVNLKTGSANKLGLSEGDDEHSHWVLITGVSSQWNYSDSKSPWNWVRVLNPFDNRIEYYWWEDFRKSWYYISDEYKEVTIQEKKYDLDK